jgi:ankyrin repeat protein
LETDAESDVPPPQHFLLQNHCDYDDSDDVLDDLELALQCLQVLMISEQAVMARDSRGQNMLRCACRKGPEVSFLKVLTDVSLNALLERDNQGRIALHEAVVALNSRDPLEHEECVECVRFLLEKFPGGARVADNSGTTPLHLACEDETVSMDIVYLLVRSDPIRILGRW